MAYTPIFTYHLIAQSNQVRQQHESGSVRDVNLPPQEAARVEGVIDAINLQHGDDYETASDLCQCVLRAVYYLFEGE